MANDQLHLTQLLNAVGYVLEVFDFPLGSAMIKRVTTHYESQPNNTQLLTDVREELNQLPPLAKIEMSSEMRHFLQALVDSVKSTNIIDQKFITRSINKLFAGFEPFARNEIQRKALIDMQVAKEAVTGVEARHSILRQLEREQMEQKQVCEHGSNEELQMTRELKAADV